jgi:hypothetical protein
MSSTDAKPDTKSTPPRRPSADKSSSSARANDEAASENAQAELTTAIDQLLDAVGSKFKAMSKDIMAQSTCGHGMGGARK